MSGYPGQVHHGDELEHAGAAPFDLLGDEVREKVDAVQRKIASAGETNPANPAHPSHREWLAAVGNAIHHAAAATGDRRMGHPGSVQHRAWFEQLGGALGLFDRHATGSGYPGHVHHGDELEHAGFSASRGYARQFATGSGYPGQVHHGDELEHAGAEAPLPVQPPKHPTRDHGVRYFDPELASHNYTTIARGRFHVCRTNSGRYYACVSVETLLGHLCVAIHLERHAVQALVEAQREHMTKHATATGAASAYGAELARVGLHPDNPDQMYAQLMRFVHNPKAFKEADASWPGARDNLSWYESPKGVAHLIWPFGGGKWLSEGPKNEAQIRAVFKIPAGVGTKQALAHLYGFPFRSDLRYSLALEAHGGGGGFDLGSTVSSVVSNVEKQVEHVAAPVVHAVTDVANKTAAAIDSAAKSVAKDTGKLVSDAVKEGAKIVAKAHLGDLNAGKMIGDIVNTAKTGVDSLGHAVDDATHLRFQKMADGLAQGAQFIAHNVDFPKILADAIPIPEVRGIAQGIVGLVDPAAKFEKAVGALRAGDMNALKAMANQELGEAQGVISLVPGVGSGISAAIGTAEAVLNGGKPLEIALRTAYGLLPIPPGIRQITDTVLDAVIAIANGGDVSDAALAVARDRIPSGMPRDVFDTLVQIIAKHQPIEKAAGDLAGHYVMQYTQGLVPAVEHGLQTIVPAHVADILHGLPDMTQKFAGFAPQFKQVAHVAEAIRSGAPRMAAVASLAQPTIMVNRALPAASQALPAAPRRNVPLRLGA